MHIEVSVAVNFVVSFLYGKLPRRRVHMLGEELDTCVRAKFLGHWYPDQPLKGTAYRSLKVSGDHPDPMMFDSAREVGLEVVEIFQHLPDNLTLWIDPGEVSYKIGEKGAVTVLYTDKGQQHHQQSQQFQLQQDSAFSSSEFNPDAQDFIPIADQLMMTQNFAQLGLSGQPSPPMSQQQQQITAADLNNYLMQKSSSTPNFFTAAAFAQTKFGSTKLRQQTRRPNRLHAGAGGAPGGFSESGRRPRGLAGASPAQQPPQQSQQQQQQQQQQPGSGSGYSAFNRSFSLSPGLGVDWSTGLNGPGAGGAVGSHLLSVHIPGGLDYHHSNGSSRQASPGVVGNGSAGRQSELLLLAK